MTVHSPNTHKIGKVMSEFKRRTLRSGSKTGHLVKKRNQAVAIGLSEHKRFQKGLKKRIK